MSSLIAMFRLIRYGQTWTPFIVNAVINALAGWLTFRDKPYVSVWGSQETVFADLLGTSFFLPLITSLVASAIVSRAVAGQTIQPLSESELPLCLRWFRKSVAIRSVLFGAAGLLLAVLPVGLLCLAFGQDHLSVAVYVVVKVTYAVILGMIVTPLIVAVAQSMAGPM
jgi:hypothetical protein